MGGVGGNGLASRGTPYFEQFVSSGRLGHPQFLHLIVLVCYSVLLICLSNQYNDTRSASLSLVTVLKALDCRIRVTRKSSRFWHIWQFSETEIYTSGVSVITCYLLMVENCPDFQHQIAESLTLIINMYASKSHRDFLRNRKDNTFSSNLLTL